MVEKERRERVRRESSEWSALVEEQAGSGLSQLAFWTSRGVSLSSFCAATKRRLAVRATPALRMEDFLEVSAHETTPTGWEFELDLGDGVVLRLRRG